MICPLHRKPKINDVCPICEKENIVVIHSEFDKQSRIIDTTTYDESHIFLPERSFAVLIFKKRGS